MTIKETIAHLRKSPKDAWYYVQGSLRFKIYKSKLRWILRRHIIEQVEWRRDQAALPCFRNGTCFCCGCNTPAVFFAHKGCAVGKARYAKECRSKGENPCYPALMSKKDWKVFDKTVPENRYTW